jgi:TPR repeat protein
LAALSEAWERAYASDGHWQPEEPPGARALIDEAEALHESAPALALELYHKAAAQGSAFALEALGWHYQSGTGVAADLECALEYHRSAIVAGSWPATIAYARLLDARGLVEQRDAVLEDGVSAGFVPAFYWLGRFRHVDSADPAVLRGVKPLIEHAAALGHPDARALLGKLKLRGHYGLRHIPSGLRMGFQIARSAAQAEEEAYKRGTGQPAEA